MLVSGSEDVSPESLGLVDYELIPFQPGMIRATLTEAELTEVAARPEVEAIDPDDEVRTF